MSRLVFHRAPCECPLDVPWDEKCKGRVIRCNKRLAWLERELKKQGKDLYGNPLEAQP